MIPFRFDRERHVYSINDARIPHITGMLKQAKDHKGRPYVDDRWFTEEGRERGQDVHDLTAAYDLGAVTLETCRADYREYLLQHVQLTNLVRPEWRHIEVPFVHREYGYGGRPDRTGKVMCAESVVEVKSTDSVEDWHAIQLALQALLVAQELGIPAWTVQRYGWYVTRTRGFVEHFHNRADFDKAREVIRQCCGV